MTEWTYSVVIIVPEALQEKANILACSLSHDTLPGNTFSIPLTDGTNTFYGCRTAAKQEFLDVMGSGNVANIDEYDITEQDVIDILTAIQNPGETFTGHLSVRPAEDMVVHFPDVLTLTGLTVNTTE